MDEKKTLLSVRDLKVSFFTPAGEVKAVNGISYDLGYNEVMGIVGESGSGKSVEAYSIIGLLQSPGRVTGGTIEFEGENVLGYTEEQMRQFRGQHDLPESDDLPEPGLYDRQPACRGADVPRQGVYQGAGPRSRH